MPRGATAKAERGKEERGGEGKDTADSSVGAIRSEARDLLSCEVAEVEGTLAERKTGIECIEKPLDDVETEISSAAPNARARTGSAPRGEGTCRFR